MKVCFQNNSKLRCLSSNSAMNDFQNWSIRKRLRKFEKFKEKECRKTNTDIRLKTCLWLKRPILLINLLSHLIELFYLSVIEIRIHMLNNRSTITNLRSFNSLTRHLNFQHLDLLKFKNLKICSFDLDEKNLQFLKLINVDRAWCQNRLILRKLTAMN